MGICVFADWSSQLNQSIWKGARVLANVGLHHLGRIYEFLTTLHINRENVVIRLMLWKRGLKNGHAHWWINLLTRSSKKRKKNRNVSSKLVAKI